MDFDQSFEILKTSLADVQHARIPASEFCKLWRAQTGLLSALPSRYLPVMEDLLGRLEAGSLFTEESCSFSQDDLYANLTVWLDKARQVSIAN